MGQALFAFVGGVRPKGPGQGFGFVALNDRLIVRQFDDRLVVRQFFLSFLFVLLGK